jgi:hypothetical protein
MIKVVNSVSELIRELEGHPCGCDRIVEKDRPMLLRLGWECKECGQEWEARLSLVGTGGFIRLQTRLRELGVMGRDPFSKENQHG